MRRMEPQAERCYTAFAGDRRIVTGPLEEMLRRTWRRLHARGGETVLIFEDETGREVDFDLRGEADEVVARALAARGGGWERVERQTSARSRAHQARFGAHMTILVTGGGGRAAHALAMRSSASPMRREGETGTSIGQGARDGSESL
jgi:hypothetical protein